MNLKYYLRGLGIGIVVTALLMGFALKGTKEQVTDEEVIARAEQLGMVQSGVLSKDLQDADEMVSENHAAVVKAESSESEKAAEAEKQEDMSNPVEKKEPAGETIDNRDEETDQKETDQKETDQNHIITVYSGDDSLNVANRLGNMGIIQDAAAFDGYLCRNGYDKRLATGSHTVKPGMSDKELAQALTRSEN